MFKTETHLHVSEVSKCSHLKAADAIRLCYERGYNTVFVTDHFSRTFFESLGDIPWNEKIALFMRGYDNAKAAGDKLGINVIFAVEFTVDKTPLGNRNHYLLYGVNKEFFNKSEDIFDMPIEQLYPYAKENGILVIQAHPLRKGNTPTPEYVDGLEAINTNPRQKNDDKEVLELARKFNLPVSSGSDTHRTEDILSGVLTEYEIKTAEDFIKAFKFGEITLIERKKN